MINKRFLFKLTAVILCMSCVFSTMLFSSPVYSADEELEDLQNQYDELQKQIDKNQKELKQVQGEMSTTKTKLNALNSEISSINSQIGILDSRIGVLNGKINGIEADITKTNGEITDIEADIEAVNGQITEAQSLMQDTREQLLGRIRENYMSGDASTIELLFSSEDLSTYFARKELMTRVSESDTALMKDVEEKIKTLNELEGQLEDSKTALNEKNEQLEAQKVDLDAKKADENVSRAEQQAKKSEVSSKQQEVATMLNELDKESEEYKATIKRQRAEQEQLSKQIDAYIKEHGSSVGDTPDAAYENDGNMAWPVKFESYVSCAYGRYSDGSPHWGMDICAVGGNTRGRPFNAAQGGKVILAVNDGNWNYGFGNYCVIDHGDGKQTLYAHSDNIQVYVGQIVKKGQQIGIVGATGNVTGPHLHFEVRIKNADGSVSRVNPANYVRNTTA